MGQTSCLPPLVWRALPPAWGPVLPQFLMHIIGSCEFDGWGARSSMTPGEMEALAALDAFHFDHIGLALFTQFHLHGQLQAASAYASQHSVVFKRTYPLASTGTAPTRGSTPSFSVCMKHA